MNEHRRILNLERCLRENKGFSGRVFGDSYAGLYVIKGVQTQKDIPLIEGGIPTEMKVLYWDFRDRPPYEREFEVQKHLDDRAFPADLLLMALQGLQNARTEYIKGVLDSEEILVEV